MTQTPNPGSEPPRPEPRRSRTRWRRVRRVVVPVGVVVLVGAGGAAWWGWRFLHEDLSPFLETNLTKLLDRPVKVGRLESVGLSGLRLGASSIPATATDPDQAKVEAIDVSFDLWQALMTRKLTLDLTLVRPDLYLDQEKQGWIRTKVTQQDEKESQFVVRTIRIQDANVELLPLKPDSRTQKRIPMKLVGVSGKADVFDNNKRFAYEVAARSLKGGNVQIQGESRLPKPDVLDTKLSLRAEKFQVAEVDRLVGLPFDLPVGTAGGNLTVELRPNATKTPIYGTATFENASLVLRQSPQAFTKASGALRFQGLVIQLDQVKALFGKVPLIANGAIDQNNGYALTAQVKPTSLANILETLKVKLPFVALGEILADLKVTGPIDKPVLSGVAKSTKPGTLDRLNLSRYGATFKLDTAAQDVVIQSIQAVPAAGGQVTGSGRIDLATKDANNAVRPGIALSFLVLNVPGDPIAKLYSDGNPLPVTVGRIDAQAQISGFADNPQTFVRWRAPGATYPGSGEIAIANNVTTLRNTIFQVLGGTLTAEAVAKEGRWQALINGAGIPLQQFSPDLRGIFSGRFNASGTLASFKPADIRAEGQARLSEGISVIQDALTAQVQWNGRELVVQQATATGFSANGIINAKLEGTPAVTGIDLNVRLSDYDLKAFGVSVPANITYAGRTDFDGRVQGTPAAPSLAGNLALKRFVLNGVAFEPYLKGRVRYSPQGTALDLNGDRDRIALSLDSRFQPLGFDIRRDDAIAKGQTRNGILYADIQNFPLSLAQTLGFPAGYAPSGTLNANLAINWARQTANGDVLILNPRLGGYLADRFSGKISYANGMATLTDGELRRGATALQLGGNITNLLGSNPQVKGQIKLAQSQAQDILKTLQIFDIQDFQRGTQPPTYGTAANLQTVPVELAFAPVLDQLRRLAEVEALLGVKKAEREAAPIPELRELTGQVAGTIDIAGSLRNGIKADFDLRGENFQWGNRFVAKTVVAIGTFENGSLTLLPLRLQSDDAVVAFSGQVFGKEQSGQLRVENLPLSTLTGLVPLPIAADGLLNLNATLSGSFTNPQAVGSLSLANGVLNGTQVQSARGNFTYANARLDFTNTVALNEKEPLAIVGSIPYQLPFATVRPDNDQIRLDIDVKNEGLALLNVLTDQVAWVNGQGTVNVKVRGTLKNPIASGFAEVNNATLQARALPDPLTNVSGRAQFDTDRLRVERITGDFNQGKVLASGVLPLAVPFQQTDPDQNTPLTVALDKIRLNLKGLYRGGADGQVIVAGTALAPKIGGNIRLSEGQVLLSEAAGASAQTGGDDTQNAFTVELADLQLELGNGVVLSYPPFLSFVAVGKLDIGGTLNDIRPDGVISLRSGQINLFTTRFTLERGYPQTATFTPEQRLSPDLNVRMVALVPEVRNRRQPGVLSPSEVLDLPETATSLGSVQTVRVRAEVQGSSTRLLEALNNNRPSDSLVLTSSPRRSQEEIVALIGGSFVDRFARGGDALLGVADLAGNALLGNIQSTIGNALGLSEFRLFPARSNEDDSKKPARSTGTLGLAAEAAVDVTPAISVSVLKILTNNQPAQFGFRYRLNDNLLLRGSTDFSGDNRATVEYELRF
jgi:translocation and assembly module TamB